MTRRTRARSLTDRDLWHAILDHWGAAMTSETDEEAVQHFVDVDRYLAEAQRRDDFLGKACVCEACMDFRTEWDGFYG